MRNGYISMVKISLSILFVALTLSLNANAGIPSNAARPKYVPDEILVKFKDGVSEKQKSMMRRLSANQGDTDGVKAQLLKKQDFVSVEKWSLDAGQDVEQVQKELIKNADILYAEPNYYLYPLVTTPNDFYYTKQWGLNNTGQVVNDISGTAESDMEMEEAWDIQTGSAAVTVAVIDDGVQINHPDLVGNIVAGRDVLSNDSDATPHNPSVSTHGTKVTGIIGAVGNNNAGVTGVAWGVGIMPILFADDDGGTIADAVDAFAWARANGADILNYSYGAMSYSQALADAVTALETAGILIVAPAGNGDVNNDMVPIYIGNLTNKNIITVAASNQYDRLASWSQYGQTSVDVMAPGVNVCTTTTSSDYTCTDSDVADGDDNNNFVDGTSFSAPYVAGVAALVKSQYPAADYQEIKGRIMAGVDAKSTARNKMTSGGRVNAENALIVAETEVLVVKSVSVDASGNGVIDSGETASVSIGIENVWINSTDVSAVLSTTDTKVTIGSATKSYGDIAKGGSASATFSITLGSINGYRNIPFRVDISANGYAVTRYFNLITGRLYNDSTYNAVIQTDSYDDVHYYHFTVAPDAPELKITTTSGNDIDLFVMRGGRPPVAYWGSDYDVDSNASFETANTISGNETITILNPDPGEYFAAVYNYGQSEDTSYTINAQGVSSGGAVLGGGSGGGAISILSLLLIFGFGATLRIRKH